MKKILSVILSVVLLTTSFQTLSTPVNAASSIPTVYISGSSANGYGHNVTITLTSPATEPIDVNYQIVQGSAHGISGDNSIVSDGPFISTYSDVQTVQIPQGQSSKTVTVAGHDPGSSYEEEQRVYFVQLMDVSGNALINKSQDIVWLYHKEVTNILSYGTHTLAKDTNTYRRDDNGLIARLPSGGVTWENTGDAAARYWPKIGVNEFKVYLDTEIKGDSAWSKMYFDVNGSSDGYWYERDYDAGRHTLGARTVDANDKLEAVGYSSDAEAVWGGDYCEINYMHIYGEPVDTDSPDVIQVMHTTGNYGAGSSLIISVMFDEIVRVDNGQVPQLPIQNNEGNEVYAKYVTGSGTDVLVFSYPVAQGVQANQLKLTPSNPFHGEAYVKDIAGNPMDQSTFTAKLNNGVLDANTTIDGSFAKMVSYSTNVSNKVMTQGDTVDITLNFNKAVKILGNASLSLNNGAQATRTPSSTLSTSHTFRYTVGSDSSYDVSKLLVTELQGATIVDNYENVGVDSNVPTNIDGSNLSVDNTAPVIAIDYKTNHSIPEQYHIINITATDSIAGINGANEYQYSIGNATYNLSDKLGVDLTVSQNDPVKVYIKVTDAVGNSATAITDLLYMDKTAPEVTFGYSSGLPKSVGMIDVSVRDEGGMPDTIGYEWYNASGNRLTSGNLSGYSGTNATTKTSILDSVVDGLYKLKISATDSASNSSVVTSSNIYIDKSKPQLNILPTNGRKNQKSYQVTINATDDNGTNQDGQISYIKYKWDNGQVTGNWQTFTENTVSFDYDNGGLSGEAVLTVKTGDGAGSNGSENVTESSYTFTFDHTVPELIITSDDFHKVTSQASIYIEAKDINVDTGAQEDASYVYYAINSSNVLGDVLEWQQLNGSRGTITKNSGNGNYYVHAKAVDAVGNEVIKVSQIFTMDTAGAEGTIDIVQQVTMNDTVELKFTTDDPQVMYALSEDGVHYGGYKPFENGTIYTFSDKTEGIRTLYAGFKDGAGNITYASDTLVLDRTAPIGEITYDVNELTNTSVTATLVNLQDAMTSQGNLIISENSWLFEANGNHTFSIKDEAGNIGYVTAQVDWINKVKPTVTFTPNSDSVPSQTKNLVITAKKEGYTVSPKYRLLGEDLTVIKPYEAFESPLTLTLEENGPVYVEVLAIDQIGNEIQERSGLFVTDNLPPKGEINYSTIKRTANDVTATISFDEGATITNNDGSDAYTFSENGAFKFTFVDTSGNEGTAVATVNNIDRSIPTANISLSTQQTTNTDILATVTVEDLPSAKIGSATLDSQSLDVDTVQKRTVSGEEVVWYATYIIRENGFLEVEIEDVETGINSVASISIRNIDKAPPLFSYFLNTTEPTNENLIMTVACSDVMSEPVVIQTDLVPETDGTYTITENGLYTFIVEDALGNSRTEEIHIGNIDKTFTPYVVYDIDTYTNQEVTATVVSDSEDVYMSDGVSPAKYVFTENGSHTFNVRDVAGNKTTIEVTVDWIDKVGSEFEIVPSTINKTNEAVTLTITPSSILKEVTCDEGLPKVDNQFNIFRANENGVYHFKTTDLYGNVKSLSYYVGNIDNTAPSLDYTLGLETASGRVIKEEGEVFDIACSEVRIDFTDEEVYEFVSYDASLEYDGGAHAFTVKNNGTYTFIAEDIAGNESTKTITITNIDQTPPIVRPVYSITETTTEPVVVSIESDEDLLIINNFNKPYRLFTSNESFTFIVSDLAGNQIEVTAVVNNIDRTAPKVAIGYSTTDRTRNPVVARLTAEESFYVYDGGWVQVDVGNSYTYTFDYNHSAFFKVRDEAGNETTVYGEVTNIDLTAPNINFQKDSVIRVPLGESNFDFISYAYADSSDFSHFTVDTSSVNFAVEGLYEVAFFVYDDVGNSRSVTKGVEVLDLTKPLIVRINGENPEKADYIKAAEIQLELLNIHMSKEIYWLKGQESITTLKQSGHKLEGLTIPVEESGWYSLLIVDKDMNRRYYEIYVSR